MTDAKTYTTVQGDMWDSIAFRQMGSCIHTDALIAANSRHCETFIFEAGVVLTLPEPEKESYDTLPPWNRGSRKARKADES